MRRHGDRIDDVLQVIYEQPELAEPLSDDVPYRKAEAVVAIRNEGAMDLSDILVRRTRTAMEARDGGRAAAEGLRAVMAAELGWDDARMDAEIEELMTRQDIVMPPVLRDMERAPQET